MGRINIESAITFLSSNSPESAQLQRTYPGAFEAQRARYLHAYSLFLAKFGSGPVAFFRAPGRVNLIGGHTDYNNGYVLPVAIDRDVLVLVRARDDRRINLANTDEQFEDCGFSAETTPPRAAPGHWSQYARGVAAVLIEKTGYALSGADILISADAPHGVPRGAGLSSSSALTVALLIALCHVERLDLSPETLVQLASDAEWYVGTRGGIMDQFASLLGKQGQALFLDCDPTVENRYKHVPLPADFQPLLIDSGVKHENATSNFNQRVAACRAGVVILQRDYPKITHLRNLEHIDWATLSRLLPREITVANMGDAGKSLLEIPGITPDTELKVRLRCEHIWDENRRVLLALDALNNGDFANFGKLMIQAHDSVMGTYDTFNPIVDKIATALSAIPGVLGYRVTGSGWGGCLVALVKPDAAAQIAKTIHEELPTTNTFLCNSSDGASLLFTI